MNHNLLVKHFGNVLRNRSIRLIVSPILYSYPSIDAMW